MKFYNLLTDQKKEGLFNFRSKNTIKKDNFNKYLQKLVNRLIDLNRQPLYLSVFACIAEQPFLCGIQRGVLDYL